MKKVFIFLTILIAILNFIFLYERDFGRGGFGPAAMFVEAVLVSIFLIFLISSLLYNTRLKETITRIWLVVISFVVTFVIVELAASYFLITPLSPPLVPDEFRHHKLVPNTNSYFEQRDFSYIQRVNNVGLRGKDIKIEKTEGEYRILMLGDSFTMGKGVEDDQTFSVLVEELLRNKQTTSGKHTIKLLNGGTDSYSPILSYIQLTGDLKQLEPDMVILNLDVSDLVQETVYRKQAIRGPGGEIAGVPGSMDNKSLTDRIRGWTERNLYMTRLILFYTNKLFDYKDYSVRHIVTQANFEIAKHTLAEDTDDRTEQWQNIFDSINKIKHYCEANSMEFILTIYPWGHQVNEREWIPGRYNFIPEDATISDKYIHTIEEFSDDNNIQLINLFPSFRSYNGNGALYFDIDAHFTVNGHILMAEGIYQFLMEKIIRKDLPDTSTLDKVEK